MAQAAEGKQECSNRIASQGTSQFTPAPRHRVAFELGSHQRASNLSKSHHATIIDKLRTQTGGVSRC